MEGLITFINDLATDLFYEEVNVDGRTLFTSGACYELYSLMKIYYPGIELYESNDHKHCAFEYRFDLYDANGLIENRSEYHKASTQDELMMQEFFGGNLKHLNIIPRMCAELCYVNMSEIIEQYNKEKLKQKIKNKY